MAALRQRTPNGNPSQDTLSADASLPTSRREPTAPLLLAPTLSPHKPSSPLSDQSHTPSKDLRRDTPDRRVAFQRYAEHASDTFRSELYAKEQPRQLLFLTIAVAILIYLAFSRDVRSVGSEAVQEGFDERSNAQAAFLAATALFAVYGAVQFRDSLMVRPHPIIWRVIHAFGVIYFVMLAILFVQPLEGARSIVRLLSPQPIDSFKPVDPFPTSDV